MASKSSGVYRVLLSVVTAMLIDRLPGTDLEDRVSQ